MALKELVDSGYNYISNVPNKVLNYCYSKYHNYLDDLHNSNVMYLDVIIHNHTNVATVTMTIVSSISEVGFCINWDFEEE